MNAEHILLTIILALSAWTLQSVVKLREQLAGLPCRKCPLPFAEAALLAFFLFSAPLSADPATNATDQAPAITAAPPETVVGSATTISVEPSSVIPSSTAAPGGRIPWQTIFDWLASIALPSLIALWRKHAAQSARAQTVLNAVVQGVEMASRALGGDGQTVKAAIHREATAAGVQTQLDKVVQAVTQNP
jgi:hypothetical protein